MKLLQRRNSRSFTPEKEELPEEPTTDSSPKGVFDYPDELTEKPPGKCVLDVSALRMDRRSNRGRNQIGQIGGALDYDARELEQGDRSGMNKQRSASLPVETATPAETDTILEEEDLNSLRQDKQNLVASDIFTSLAQPSYGGRSKKNRNKKSIAPMPTLDEALIEEDHSTVAGGEDRSAEMSASFDSWDESNMSFETEPHSNTAQSPKRSKNHGSNTDKPAQSPPREEAPVPTGPVQPTVTQLLTMEEHKKACVQIRTLMEEAKIMAAEGREEESIQTYKKALQAGRQDVHRIKSHLRKKCSVAEKFYQDWVEIGVILSEIRTCQAHLHERVLDYDHAISCLQEAVSIYKRQITFFKGRSKEKASTLDQVIANLETVVARVQNAKKHDAKRKQYHESILQFQKNAVMSNSMKQRQEAFYQMEMTAKTLRSLETNVMGELHPLVADANSLLGAIKLEQGDIEGALNRMREALAIMKKSLGMKHPRTGTKLLNLASVYSNQGQDLLALDHYNMATAVFRSCNADKLVASTLNDVSVVHIRRKEYERSITLLHESLEAYKATEKGNAKAWETAQVWRNLGESYNHQKEFANGATAFMSALNIQREGRALVDKELATSEDGVLPDYLPPFQLVSDVSIADTMRRLGKAYFGARKFENALTYYKDACVIHKAEVKKVVHVSKSRTSLSLPQRQDELAQTIYCIAEVYDQTAELDQAMKLYSESLQLRLFSDAHKEKRTNLIHCAMCLYGMGGVHIKLNENEEAVAVTSQALTYCEAHGVPENNVIYIMIRKRLDSAKEAVEEEMQEKARQEEEAKKARGNVPTVEELDSLELEASDFIDAGQLDDAVKTLTNVMQKRKVLLQDLKSKGEDSTILKYDTACTLHMFGQVLEMQEKDNSAEKAYKDSLKLFKKSGTSPEDPAVVRLCEALGKLMKRQQKKEKA